MEKEIQNKACIWATHHRHNNSYRDDLLLVKERVQYTDGTEESKVRLIPNMKRPYWITKPDRRDHEQKRIHEAIENTTMYQCTQSELARHAAKNLGHRSSGGYVGLTDVAASPYLYGTDVTSPVIIKEAYKQEYPNYTAMATVAVADYETDVLYHDPDDKFIIMGAVTMGPKWRLVILQSFLGQTQDAELQINRIIDKYIKKYKDIRKATLELIIVDKEIDVPRKILEFAHEHMPDYLAFWNVKFDIQATLEACHRANVDPADLFCSPNVPAAYRSFKWWEDPQIKEKANGDKISKDFTELWHRVEAPMPFYIVDAMVFYRIKRVHKGKLTSYSLDAILERELGLHKLKLTDSDELGGLEWHRAMQEHHKLFYAVYNVFDCVGVELLDEKTKDLSVSLDTYCGSSEIKSATSNPKRLSDDANFKLIEQGRVICSTSKDMTHAMDYNLIGKGDWIITLASERVYDTGRSIIIGVPDSASRISAHGGDVDVASGYPTAGTCLNVSSSSTMAEIYGISNLPESEVRRIAVNMSAPKVNAIDLSATLFQTPLLTELEDIF